MITGFTVILMGGVSFCYSQANGTPPPLDEDLFLYKPVPDILIDTGKTKIQLSSLWQERPLLLAYVYAECKGRCSPYLLSFSNAVNTIGGVNRDYNVLILSFDTTDNISRVRAFCRMAGIDRNQKFIIGTTNAVDLKKITNATGFWYKQIGNSNQLDHPVQITGIANGQIRRIITGDEVAAQRLNEAVQILSGYFVRSYPMSSKNILFRCFETDPETGAVKITAGAMIFFVPAMGILVIIFYLFYFKNKKTV
ncbi:MAG: hypothetical protein OJF59_002720 [Cytophagales bacterium]|jgi:cytochrome oxidase Cu insertion factor (SCO1/SenC/PrrC family)|nr:MAG: hypothetical protein OJF59_002720 [Cytophagales bacterium]